MTSVPPVCALVPASVTVPVPFFVNSPVPVRPAFSVVVDALAVSITPPPAPIVNVRLLTTVLPLVTRERAAAGHVAERDAAGG